MLLVEKKAYSEVKVEINNIENFKIEATPDNDDIHTAKWKVKRLISGEDAIDLLTKRTDNLVLVQSMLTEISRIEKELKQANYDNYDSLTLQKSFLKKESDKIINPLKSSNKSIIESFEVLSNFLIYCLNTPALRGLTSQSHKEPVGIFGEGLDVLMANFDKEERTQLAKYSYMIDWLEDFMLDTQDVMKFKGYKLNRSKSTLYFADKYMAKKNNVFSSENANEGILHVLFYLSVMISKRTPKFFAIDNIESCLNPHLCRHLMSELCQLAKDTDKQLMITTHNPAILDGLNLFDDEVRLFEVKRNEKGHTITRRIKIKPDTNLEKYKISELWTRGYLGAIAENF